MIRSQLFFQELLPVKLDFSNCVLIYDQILQSKYPAWIKKFPNRIAVKSGEKLKELRNFPKVMEEILRHSDGISREQLTIVAFGGGSVGDFAGFVASILKRGVGLIQVPSTWLSAIDSAHGGKTALNAGASKNQLGTFYPAQAIYMIKEVLTSQPVERLGEAAGEYYKTALLDGGSLWKKASRDPVLDAEKLWRELPQVVNAKWKVVRRDPYEKKDIRHILNLGHTVGHVLESELGLAHGKAVHLGLSFALAWGQRRGFWKFSGPSWMLPSQEALAKELRKIRNPKGKLLRDKKIASGGKIRFVFIQSPGKPRVQKVSLKELVQEWQRQAK